MSYQPPLTAQQVSLFIQDNPETNYLLDNVEFTEDRINLSMNFAVQAFNFIPPLSTFNTVSFPDGGILLMGTLAYLFQGQAAFFARNSLPYSDGNIQVNLEERMEPYTQLADNYMNQFLTLSKAYKTEMNIESGFNWLPSDIGTFPYF